MNKSALVGFIFGAAVGSLVSWYVVKRQYERVEPLEDTPSQEDEDQDIMKEKINNDIQKEKPSVAEYARELSKKEYRNYSNSEFVVEEDEDEEDEGPIMEPPKYERSLTSKPYVIPPEEFGEYEDYDKISIKFYSDHLLVDDNDELIEDVEGTIGFESLNHFGEYEDDSVYVRNERLTVDYEILLDQRKYMDVLKSKPYLRRPDGVIE